METNFSEEQLTPEQKWERATIANNFIFYKVMHNNPDVCKEFLERLLDMEIDSIEMAQEEQVLGDLDSKSIRMDVYAKNATESFDLEMQTIDTKELPERARYYQGIMDVDNLSSGEVYSKLKTSYVIFLCKKDVFNMDLCEYKFESLCVQDPKIQLGDRAYKYFFIWDLYAKIQNTKLRELMEFISQNKTTGDFSKRIQSLVEKAKKNTQWRHCYMEYERQRTYDMEAGFQKGIEQGRQQGNDAAKLESAVIAVREFNISSEIAAIKFGVNLDNLKAALKVQ